MFKVPDASKPANHVAVVLKVSYWVYIHMFYALKNSGADTRISCYEGRSCVALLRVGSVSSPRIEYCTVSS